MSKDTVIEFLKPEEFEDGLTEMLRAGARAKADRRGHLGGVGGAPGTQGYAGTARGGAQRLPARA